PTQADFLTPRSGPDEVGGAAPPIFVPLWQRVASIVLCIFLLFSPAPVSPVAAEATAAFSGAFENTENFGGVIRLIYGYTSGTFTSEAIYIGENWEGLALWWREEEPTAVQEVLIKSSSVENAAELPLAGMSPGPVAESWKNITISGYQPSTENAGETEAIAPGAGTPMPVAESWTNITISGYWASENSLAEGSSENSLPKFAALGPSENLEENVSLDNQQSSENTAPPENSPPLENILENSAPDVSENTGLAEDFPENIPQENSSLPLPENLAAEKILLTSRVRVQVRVSADGVEWGEWMGPDGSSSSYFEEPPASLSRLPPARYLQWRVLLSSDGPRLSGAAGPSISGIVILKGENIPLENFAYEDVEQLEMGRKVGVRMRRVERGRKVGAEFLGRPELPLKRVSLKPIKTAENVEIWADVLEELPAGVPSIESGAGGEGNGVYFYPGGVKVYSYLDISTTLESGVLEEAEVEFGIPKSWMEAKGVKPSAVKIYHFNGSGWEKLPAAEVGEADGEVIFSARTSGFSPFALAYVTGETVYEGGTSGISGSQDNDGVYENIYENNSVWENFILLWDGPTIPAGWVCISDEVGEPFYGRFPRG
ncbi:MAG: PGF-pre-PGF domain-containing protein, partial [Candidatus Hadarchaeales archaeon]